MKVTQEEYLEYKQQVRGIYQKLNDRIIPSAIYKIVNYKIMLKLIPNFNSFENFIHYFTSGKDKKIEQITYKMAQDADKIGIKIDKDFALKCLIVRFGNVYNGIYTEHQILNRLSNLTNYIKCEKSTDEIDMTYKVDAILTIEGVNSIAIQIKPISYLRYDSKSELEYHKQYKLKFNNDVVYFYYDNQYNIIINNETISLDSTEELVKVIEKLL